MPAASAAYVWIRLDGQVIGRGLDIAANPMGDSSCIGRAAGAAIDEARKRAPVERDALLEDNLRAVSGRLAVTVELAGAFVPFVPKEQADIAAAVNFGVEGVAVRMGDRLAAMFPEQMLVTATEPGAGAASLVSRLGDDPTLGLKKPAELIAERGATFYRFKTTTIAHPRAGGGAMFLTRGGRVVREGEITEAGLRGWANELAEGLGRRLLSLDNSNRSAEVAGTFDAVKGAWELPPSQPAQVLLGVLALHAFNEIPDSPREIQLRASRCSQELFEVTARRMHGGGASAPVDLNATALMACLLADHFRVTPPTDAPDLVEYGVLLRALEDDAERPRGLLNAERELRSTVPSGVRPLIAMALTYDRGEGGAVIRQVFRETQPGNLAAQMPWLGWAELKAHATGDIPSAVALREMRSLVWQHQLNASDLAPDQQDLAGGIVFTASRQPVPTWQAARPLAFIATMLGDERLTPEAEVPAELAHLLASLRFLRQLTAEEGTGHMYADPARATGGVRVSVWDQHMPPEATAMTLLTVCETLQSLEKIKARASKKIEAATPGSTGAVRDEPGTK